eukprot:TRINITY_DN9165_c0_g1_i3.p1 TRINITY_DN9165_c0_g1~~TRINITY_DN9165_c0_g1_i3.p1  ORF type:complete len:473 (+),score=79.55 TRINITY_DN9165_c0_g1_i3:196-1614(+)
MGKTQSRAATLERGQAQRELLPSDYHAGLENFGNTCYCNSVLQALYSCVPFRQAIISYRNKDATSPNLLHALGDLYYRMGAKKRRAALQPKQFHALLREDNEIYNNTMQQDAQEFINYLLNRLTELVLEDQGISAESVSRGSGETPKTWVQDIFEGTLTNELKCLTCESVTTLNESFLDLSVDVTQNCSLTSCLRNFSSTETLCDDQKYQCETCCSKQEGQKRFVQREALLHIRTLCVAHCASDVAVLKRHEATPLCYCTRLRISKLPNVLAIHLKRFKYSYKLNNMQKLSWRVVHPVELRLVNVTEEAENAERIYDLFAIVIHIGQHLSRGHYISMVKSGEHWLLYDDDRVEQMSEYDLEVFFGHTELQSSNNRNSETAYLLFYQARDCDVNVLNTSAQRSVPASNNSTLSRNFAEKENHAAENEDGSKEKLKGGRRRRGKKSKASKENATASGSSPVPPAVPEENEVAES